MLQHNEMELQNQTKKKYNNFIVPLLFGDKYFINSNLELISLSYFEEFQSLFAFNQPDYINFPNHKNCD